ncbi:MAG: hypothetical protein NC388_04905 [Clostridium sp.]|nr:hypothetical protein [Clostridium sp.]
MSKQQFESNIKLIPYDQDCVYGKLADLNNLAVIKEKIQDPNFQELLREKVPADKMGQVSERLKDLKFDTDSVSCNVPPLGEVVLRIIDREAPKCIKFETANSPIPLNLWIQLLPVTASQCKMKLTVGTDLNPFIKGMVSKPLKEGVEKLADMLAMIPYGM